MLGMRRATVGLARNIMAVVRSSKATSVRNSGFLAPARGITVQRALRDFREDEKESVGDLEIPESYKDFAVSHEPGTTILELEKSFQNETVTVRVDVTAIENEENEAMPEEEDAPEVAGENGENEDEELEAQVLRFEVELSKPGTDKKLTFDCMNRQEYFEITEVTIADDNVDEDVYQTVPTIRMSEDAVTGFEDYLTERGFDTDLMEFMWNTADTIESAEVQRWARNVEDFLAAGEGSK